MGFRSEDFDRVLKGTGKRVAPKPEFPALSVESVLVVTRQNIAEIPDFIAMSEGLGVDKVHLRTLMPMESPRDGLDYHRLPPYLHPEFESLREAAVSAIASSTLPIRADPATWSRPVFSPEWESRLGRLPLTPRKDRTTYFRTGEI